MRQVLDFFDLLLPEKQDSGLVWNLSLATTNSPLTVVGEPISLKPDVDVTVIARVQKALLAGELRALTTGTRPIRAFSHKRRETVRRLFSRNLNGIGSTSAVLDGSDTPVLITPAIAQIGIDTLEKQEGGIEKFLIGDRGREEVGSIEGHLVKVGTDYNQPAILVRERKSGVEIWCRVDPGLKHKISEETSFEDVWEHRRVIVKGRIQFGSGGEILRVYANAVVPIKSRQMTIHDIKDADFTNGVNTEEYLEIVREG